ncbi:MAG: tyrosine recombinase [Anaerolineae bacterium]
MDDRIQDFLRFLDAEKGYAENTVAAYRNDLGQFTRYANELGQEKDNFRWADIDRAAITTYITHLQEQGYTSSTVARKVAAIKSFFHFLVAEGTVKDDPTATLDSPKVKKRPPKAISTGEIEQLLEAPTTGSGPKAQRDHALLELLYASGTRVTELVSLNIEDVGIDSDSNSGEVHVYNKKNPAKKRTIPISGSALQALRTYLERGRLQLVRTPDEEALFLNHRGQRLTRQGLWLIIKRYVEMVGISEEVTPHTLRHSFAAHKLSQGKSLQDIQKLLGHANISTTQVYTHLSKEAE